MQRLPFILIPLMLLAEREGDHMYGGHWHSPFLAIGMVFFVPLPGIKFQLWDVLLVLGTIAASFQPAVRDGAAEPMRKSLLLAGVTILLSSAWGIAQGSSGPNQIYFQMRMLFLSLFLGQLLMSTLRNERDVLRLGRTILTCALIRASLCNYFYFAWVRPNPNLKPFPQTMTTHDDSVLFVAGVLILIVYSAYRRSPRTTRKALPAMLWLIIAIQVNNRRLAWINLVLSLAFLYVMLPKDHVRRRVNRLLPIVAPLLALYVAVGWGRNERIFAPVRTFSSISGKSEDESSKARNEENRNLAYTVSLNLLMGTGLGHEYVENSFVYSPHLAKIFPQYKYIPHNALLGLVAFMGLLGTVGILSVFIVAAYLCARTYYAAATPVMRAAGAVGTLMTLVYFNQAYGDMGFQTGAPSIAMGAIIGVAGRGSVLVGAWVTARQRRAARRAARAARAAGRLPAAAPWPPAAGAEPAGWRATP
jgi:hypothetical protein